MPRKKKLSLERKWRRWCTFKCGKRKKKIYIFLKREDDSEKKLTIPVRDWNRYLGACGYRTRLAAEYKRDPPPDSAAFFSIHLPNLMPLSIEKQKRGFFFFFCRTDGSVTLRLAVLCISFSSSFSSSFDGPFRDCPFCTVRPKETAAKKKPLRAHLRTIWMAAITTIVFLLLLIRCFFSFTVKRPFLSAPPRIRNRKLAWQSV